ncbi:MAG: cyclic nucleotide-binding domain-containing protein [Rhodospirillaceae bacterium]|jgi:CRP/FNR family transcriptional regulator|nr:cyclic nucleotide-binding domain-containing protein [Rhodospirillaceae bacterium]
MSDSSKSAQKAPRHNCDTCDVRHKAMCAAVDHEHTDQLQAIVSHRDYSPGQVIFEEGDPADYVFHISDGEVRLYKLLPDGRRQVTGFLTPGDFLGLITESSYAYGAEAIGAVELCCMKLTNLERLLSDIPPVRERLLDMSRDELAAAQEQMLLLGRKTAREKILSFLLYRHKHLDRTDSDASIDLPMSRTDIADYLGLTIETVSRTFTALRDEGLIELPNPHHVIFPDLDAVRDAADAA